MFKNKREKYVKIYVNKRRRDIKRDFSEYFERRFSEELRITWFNSERVAHNLEKMHIPIKHL